MVEETVLVAVFITLTVLLPAFVIYTLFPSGVTDTPHGSNVGHLPARRRSIWASDLPGAERANTPQRRPRRQHRLGSDDDAVGVIRRLFRETRQKILLDVEVALLDGSSNGDLRISGPRAETSGLHLLRIAYWSSESGLESIPPTTLRVLTSSIQN